MEAPNEMFTPTAKTHRTAEHLSQLSSEPGKIFFAGLCILPVAFYPFHGARSPKKGTRKVQISDFLGE